MEDEHYWAKQAFDRSDQLHSEFQQASLDSARDALKAATGSPAIPVCTNNIKCMYVYSCAITNIIVHTIYEDHLGRTKAQNQHYQAWPRLC